MATGNGTGTTTTKTYLGLTHARQQLLPLAHRPWRLGWRAWRAGNQPRGRLTCDKGMIAIGAGLAVPFSARPIAVWQLLRTRAVGLWRFFQWFPAWLLRRNDHGLPGFGCWRFVARQGL